MLALLAVFALAGPALAVINPHVQPRHLFDGHAAVYTLRVAALDTKARAVTFEKVAQAKGPEAPARVVMTAAAEQLEAVLTLEVGQHVVVFAGRGRAKNELIYYVGGGRWYEARMDPAAPDRWAFVRDVDEDQEPGSAGVMYATFNGSVAMLTQLTADLAAGRAYFPALPFTRFGGRVVATLPAAVGGVAVADLDGDGRLDLAATSAAGCRVLLQAADGSFADASAAAGVADTPARSIAVADADADGRADLLLDASLFRQTTPGRWERTTALPALDHVVSAAFVELDGDGLPDVVVSRADAGLAVFRNAGPGKPFTDATANRGLDDPQRGAGLTGYFETGDWDGDGRTDLLYLAGPDLLLLNRNATFDAQPLTDGETPAWATAALAPLPGPDQPAALVLADDTKRLLRPGPDGIDDLTRYGNELQDDAPGLLAVLAEDLSADGTLDLYAAARDEGGSGFLCTNRGYGSFMLEPKYAAGDVLPAAAFTAAVRGVAAGDVTGDGAHDLLLGAADGKLWLLDNQTLAARPLTPDPAAKAEHATQAHARLLTVRLTGARGVTGARLRLRDAAGPVVATRALEGNCNIGSTGPAQRTLVARTPGPHTLEVTFADGARLTTPVDLAATAPRHQVLTLDRAAARADAP